MRAVRIFHLREITVSLIQKIQADGKNTVGFVVKNKYLCYNDSMERKDANQLSPLSLAFLGDGVFTLFIREYLINNHDAKSGALHLWANKFVCAKAQAKMIEVLLDELSDEEKDIARRCRNAHNTSKAKNAGLGEYKKATALEGVLGYLKLVGDDERLNYLMQKCIEIIEKGEENE